MSADCLPTDLSTIIILRLWYRVGLFGSYGKRKRLLTEGKNRLRKDGFPFTFLIEDFPDAGFSGEIRQKSRYYSKLMNLVFFTFAFGCDNQSVSLELEDFVKEKKNTQIPAVAMIEIKKNGRLAAHTITRENIEKGQLAIDYFATDEDFSSRLSVNANRCAYGLFKKVKSLASQKIQFLESIQSNPIYADRLCDVHRKNLALYICTERCRPTCRNFHLCSLDVLTSSDGTFCRRGKMDISRICPPDLSNTI